MRARTLGYLSAVALSLGCGSPRGYSGGPATDAGLPDTPAFPDVPAFPDTPAPPDAPAVDDLGAPGQDVPEVPSDVGQLPCRSSRDCSALALVCEPVSGRCVECVGANDCAAGQACVANACRAMTCSPGTSTCVDARRVRQCLADGVTETVVNCADRQVCGPSGRCVPVVCEPGVASCDAAGARRVCNPDGLGYAPSPCPALPGAPSSRCEAGACQPVCEAGRGDCDGSAANGCEASLMTDRANCGRCGAACPGSRACAAGVCEGAGVPVSCRALLQASPGTPSGVYALDPDGAGATPSFQAYCEMTLAGGGWTLAAVFTNGDSVVRWSPRLPIWVDDTTIGEATNPNTTSDAKGEAFNLVAADELMIVRRSATPVVEVQSATGCLSGRSLRATMQRNSSGGLSCAHSCATVGTPLSPWSGGSCQATGLRFRCRDTASTTTVGGFLVSTDDNSMITTSRIDGSSTCDAVNFGLGASTVAPTAADYDSDPSGTVVSSDRTARLLYVR